MAQSAKKLNAFSKALKRWREQRGLDQAQLGELIGVGVTSVSHWETNRSPSVDLLLALEFDLDPPIPYKTFWPKAKRLIHQDVHRRYVQARARCLRLLRMKPPKDA